MAHDQRHLRVAGIVDDSCVDGPGLRLAVFGQGCPHHCRGCHNPATHCFDGGDWQEVEAIAGQYRANPLLKGLTCSGGEPFCQADAFAALARLVHGMGGDVITYTGYTLELLTHFPPLASQPAVRELLRETDYLVDSPFIERDANGELPFMGSANQRFLDMRGFFS